MYKLIGGDGKEYGPVDAETLRRWIAEGRLNGRSQVQKEGAAEWKPLAEFAEFAESLAGESAAAPPGGAAPPPINSEAWAEMLMARTPQVQIGLCLSRSWQLLTSNFRLLLGATAIVWGIGWCQFVPPLNLAYQVVSGVLYGGLYLVFLKRIRGQAAVPGEVFDCFKRDIPQLVLAGFISALLAGVGMCFLLVPGIYLAIAWIFSVPLVADRRLQFWPAMELSRKVVTRVWFEMFCLVLVAFLPVVLMKIVVGTKVSMYAFSNIGDIMSTRHLDPDQLVRILSGLFKSQAELDGPARVILLFNMPFAIGALMYAYEDLFGARPTPTA
jgi:hypothetical protein